MNTVRCLICRLRFQKLKLLYIHYLRFHSKNKIIHTLLEQNSKQVSIKSHRRTFVNSTKRESCTSKQSQKWNSDDQNTEVKTYETEPIVLRENIRIFCGENEIISIGDNEQYVKVSFNNETQDHCYLDWNKIDRNNTTLPKNKIKSNSKRKIKKKKITRRKTQDYHINITKLKDTTSLDDQNGVFYTCRCRENDCPNATKFQNVDLRLATSDTESCSETSKNSFISQEDSKLFCNKCGSGYKTEAALSEHMYVHEPFCRLCNTWFPNTFSFKQHMQLHKIRLFACHMCNAEFPLKETLFKHFDSHLEDKIFDDVLDMEDEYETLKKTFLNTSYNTSLSSIMCYLKERPDMFCWNYKFMKITCDICYKEILIHDYEWHLQLFHTVWRIED